MALFIGTVVLLLCLAPMASAATFYDENVTLTSVSKMDTEDRVKLTADDSKTLRAYIDYYFGNRDGNLTQVEVDNYDNWFKTNELEKGETEYTFIDGRRGNITQVDAETSCPLGDENALGDCVTLGAESISWTLENITEHTFQRDGLQSGNILKFTVPSGWEIVTAEGFSSKSISADKKTVTGTATTGTSLVITFSKSATFQTTPPTTTPTTTSSTPPPETPYAIYAGVISIVIIIVGLVAYFLIRK